jgi:hypothetical protein
MHFEVPVVHKLATALRTSARHFDCLLPSGFKSVIGAPRMLERVSTTFFAR